MATERLFADVARPGRSYESAVARMHALMDPAAAVTHDETLVDRLGHRRQFDVVVRATVAGHEIVGVIECKDVSRKVGTPEVNAFADKANNVPAHLKVIAARSGFTKPAIELAAHHGIALIGLLRRPNESSAGFVAVDVWRATVDQWELGGLTLESEESKLDGGWDPWKMTIGSQKLMEYLVWSLDNRFRAKQEPGEHLYHLRFSAPQRAEHEGVSFTVKAIQVSLLRVRRHLRKQVRYVGEAYYDFTKRRMVIPPGGSIRNEPVVMDLHTWETDDGSPVAQMGPLSIKYGFFLGLAHVPEPIQDLGSLGEEAVTRSTA